MSWHSDYVNANCDPDDESYPVFETPVPNIEKCKRCGQNFVADFQGDDCDCPTVVQPECDEVAA